MEKHKVKIPDSIRPFIKGVRGGYIGQGQMIYIFDGLNPGEWFEYNMTADEWHKYELDPVTDEN